MLRHVDFCKFRRTVRIAFDGFGNPLYAEDRRNDFSVDASTLHVRSGQPNELILYETERILREVFLNSRGAELSLSATRIPV